MGEAQAVVAAVRLVEERELRVGPVEVARVDHDAADARAMSADPLREGVDDDVRAVLDRAQQRRGRERRIHDERQMVLPRDGRIGLDVCHVEAGIADRLDVDRARLLVDRGLDGGEVVDGREAHRDALLRQDRVELRERPAVEVVRRDDLVAQLREVRDREVDRRRARGEGQRGRAAVERRETLLEHVVRRVHQAGVDVARLLEAEQVGAVLRVTEVVGRRAVDWDVAGQGCGVRVLLSRVDGQGLEMELAIAAHVPALLSLLAFAALTGHSIPPW